MRMLPSPEVRKYDNTDFGMFIKTLQNLIALRKAGLATLALLYKHGPVVPIGPSSSL
jgi:hypothetical protein